jgi:phage tail-like protein
LTTERRFDTSHRRFDTGGVRMSMSRNGAGPDGVPPAASSRMYLRGNLPAIYQEGDFGLRFVAALETVWDPIIALLDSLPAHISPDLAPRDVLRLMCAWLGLDLDEGWAEERLRELVRHAAALARMRGTKLGLELQLSIAFPDLPLRVEETGGVYTAADPADLPPVQEPGFVVYCDVPLPEDDQAAVARAIEGMKPVHVKFRLRVKAPKKSEQEAKKQ